MKRDRCKKTYKFIVRIDKVKLDCYLFNSFLVCSNLKTSLVKVLTKNFRPPNIYVTLSMASRRNISLNRKRPIYLNFWCDDHAEVVFQIWSHPITEWDLCRRCQLSFLIFYSQKYIPWINSATCYSIHWLNVWWCSNPILPWFLSSKMLLKSSKL